MKIELTNDQLKQLIEKDLLKLDTKQSKKIIIELLTVDKSAIKSNHIENTTTVTPIEKIKTETPIENTNIVKPFRPFKIIDDATIEMIKERMKTENLCAICRDLNLKVSTVYSRVHYNYRKKKLK
jgi:hypothetical protein